MLLIMLLGSPQRTWHRRLDKSSIAFGLFTIAVGVFEFTIQRQAQREHRILHYKRAPVTPAQGYAAAVGFLVLGTITVVTALVHGRAASDQPPPPANS